VGQFLNTSDQGQEPQKFEALGQAGSEHYLGLEIFPNPGCHSITFTGDELVAHCPVTGQPDFYEFQIVLLGTEKSIESKSLKLWLRQFTEPDTGLFCEALAVFIRDQVGVALGYHDAEGNPDADEITEHIQVTLVQKSRGGISIRSVA
jgi:hypothetical protein